MTLQPLPRRKPRCHLPARRGSSLAWVSLVAALFVASLPGSARAHVDIDVGDGQYVMEIGFRDEPAWLGQPNALYLNVEEYATGGTEPVTGLAATLAAEVTKDGQTKELALTPAGEGAYLAPFVPTAAGDYTFRVFGTIGEAPIDESVTSGPTTFNSVEPLTAIEFPVGRPDTALLQAEAVAARDAAATARTIAIAGLVAGVLGLLAGGAALARSGRSRVVQRVPTAPVPLDSEPSGKLIK